MFIVFSVVKLPIDQLYNFYKNRLVDGVVFGLLESDKTLNKQAHVHSSEKTRYSLPIVKEGHRKVQEWSGEGSEPWTFARLLGLILC